MDGIIWDRTQKRDQTEPTQQAIPPPKNLNELHVFLDQIINDVQNGNLKIKLPIISYYGTDRAVFPSLQEQLHTNLLQESHSAFAYSNFNHGTTRFFGNAALHQRGIICLDDL